MAEALRRAKRDLEMLSAQHTDGEDIDDETMRELDDLIGKYESG
jgi:hypothetical protein